jgi:hypothetical protein
MKAYSTVSSPTVSVPLIVVPNSPAPPRENGLHAEEPSHLVRLEDPSLGVDQRNSSTLVIEASSEIQIFKDTILQGGRAGHIVESRLARVWVGEVAGTMVGFLSMIVGSLDPVDHRPSAAELPRIYILGSARRSAWASVGSWSTRQSSRRQPRVYPMSDLTLCLVWPYVWFDVMASADRARRADAKWGFHELGSKQFEKTVKAGLSDMVVLAKEINTPQVRL